MKLTGRLTLKDYRGLMFDRIYGGFRGKFLIASNIVLYLFTGIYILAMYGLKKSISSNLIFVIFVIMVLTLMTPAIIFSSSKRNFESDKLLQEEQTYEIDGKGVKITAIGCNSDITWDMIYGAQLNRKFISIALSKGRVFLLPAGFFREGQMRELGELLKRVLPKDKVKGRIL